MNVSEVRSHIAMAVIAFGVCAGGYAFFVLPMKGELSRAATEAQGARSAINRMSALQSTLPELIKRRNLAASRLDFARSACRVAEDEGALYAEISLLAEEAGVRVTRLAPSGGAARSSRESQTGPRSTRWSMEVSGGYGAVALFFRGLEERLGLARIRSAVITTDQTRVDTVVASVESEHFIVAPAAPIAREASHAP